MAIVRLYATLRKTAGGEREYTVDAKSVRDVLEDGKRRFGADFQQQIQNCTVLVNGKNCALLRGKKTKISEADIVAIFPPMAGG